MPLNRRQFIATSSLTACGTTLSSWGASADGIPLSANDILSDKSLSRVFSALNLYGTDVRMSRSGDAIRVRARVSDYEAFGHCYSYHGVADSQVEVLPDNRLTFTKGNTRYIVEHAQ